MLDYIFCFEIRNALPVWKVSYVVPLNSYPILCLKSSDQFVWPKKKSDIDSSMTALEGFAFTKHDQNLKLETAFANDSIMIKSFLCFAGLS